MPQKTIDLKLEKPYTKDQRGQIRCGNKIKDYKSNFA
jgi:hypothetical protein